MEDTYDQRKRRLFGRQHLSKYLETLSKLLKREIHAQDLLSIVETDKFIQSTSYFKNTQPNYKESIRFSDKATIKGILLEEITNWNVPYTMYISGSLSCGLLLLPSFSWFNLDFSFEDDPGGISSFTRLDGKEHIILDYYEELGEQFLKIEIRRIPM